LTPHFDEEGMGTFGKESEENGKGKLGKTHMGRVMDFTISK
jgi:hypothetical protein